MKLVGIIATATLTSLLVLYGLGYIGGSVNVKLTDKSKQAINQTLENLKVDQAQASAEENHAH